MTVLPLAELGDTGPLIVTVKRRLNFATVDDVFDQALHQRLRGIQATRGLEVHGCLDRPTLDVLGIPSGV